MSDPMEKAKGAAKEAVGDLIDDEDMTEEGKAQQKKQMAMFIYISPVMIMFISFTSMAALPVYWTVGGILLIIQTFIGRKFYSNHPEIALEAVEKEEAKLEEKK